MKKPKLSIIMSIYNTEAYLEKSISSILEQNYNNIELIIIEDGSTDNSKSKLKKYEDNKKIKIFYNDQNKGLAYSRNVGLDNATGEYIGFIDSDDYISKDYFEKLMNAIQEQSAEVAICDFKLIFETTGEEIIKEACEGEKNILNIINNGLAASCCNKVFYKDVINNYRFEIGKVNEDIAVVIPSLVHAKKIAYINDCYYNYYQRNNSIQNSKFSKKRFDIIEAVKLTYQRIKGCKQEDKIIESLIFNQIILLLYYVITKEKNLIRRNNILKQFHRLTKDINLLNNSTNREYIEQSGYLHSRYYTLLCYLVDHGFCFLANLLILFYQVIRKIMRLKKVIKNNIDMKDLIKLAKKQSKMKDEKITVSVVVPNYNYEQFLYQRIYSILNQDYKLKEILILDDCSNDNSKQVIDSIIKSVNKYINIRKIYNTTNSGTAFKQWKKGFENVDGDYVWIAEADDYCAKNLISSLIRPIKINPSIVISYADTCFINANGSIRRKTIKPEIDIMKSGHWENDFINDGVFEVENYAFLNCTIANVSSCLIKNGDYSDLIKESCEYKQAGDWVFYVNLLKTGKISYINKTLNYYRVHGNNVSSTMNHKKHIDEILKIYNKIKREFKITKKNEQEMIKRIKYLKSVWKI